MQTSDRDIAKGWNPDNLTVLEVGFYYRLLTLTEFEVLEGTYPGGWLEVWNPHERVWCGVVTKVLSQYTYRCRHDVKTHWTTSSVPKKSVQESLEELRRYIAEDAHE